MAKEASLIAAANTKLAALAEVRQEMVRSKAELSLALGQLVGSRISRGLSQLSDVLSNT